MNAFNQKSVLPWICRALKLHTTALAALSSHLLPSLSSSLDIWTGCTPKLYSPRSHSPHWSACSTPSTLQASTGHASFAARSRKHALLQAQTTYLQSSNLRSHCRSGKERTRTQHGLPRCDVPGIVELLYGCATAGLAATRASTTTELTRIVRTSCRLKPQRHPLVIARSCVKHRKRRAIWRADLG